MQTSTPLARLRASSGLFLGLPFALGACAATGPDVGLTIPVSSKYVARGAVFVDDPVLQPSATVSTAAADGTLSAGVWANIGLANEVVDAGETSEVDLSAGYERTLGSVTAAIGWVHYEFPSVSGPSTDEITGSLSLDEVPLTPTLLVFYDVGEADGAYVSFALSHTIDLAETCACNLTASAGYMQSGMAAFNFGVEEAGVSDVTASAGVSWAPADSIGVDATLWYSHTVDDAFGDAVSDGDVVWFVIGTSFSF